MSSIKYTKDPSCKLNKNWGHNRPAVSPKAGEYAYLSPLIREICVRCKDLNAQLMDIVNKPLSPIALDKLSDLNKTSPEILQRVIYDRDIYENLIKQINLHEHGNDTANV
jgi:hypothetical protein